MLIKGIEVDISQHCHEESRALGVESAVHSDDHIYRFCAEHPGFENLRQATSYYFQSSAKSAADLEKFISTYCDINHASFDLLEFASGYGAVTRHFKNKLPKANVISCDIHHEAVSFTQNELGVEAELSESVPEELKLSKSFDVVFALSFFSHMPKSTWGRWLASLAAQVRKGGYLIFTTHGEKSLVNFGNPKVDKEGFWFKRTSEQKDLDTEEYGMTVSLPRYVTNVIGAFPELSLVYFEEGFWWGHQDVYIVRKS